MLSITSFSENITHYMYDQTTPIGNTGHPFFRSKLLQKSVPHGADTPREQTPPPSPQQSMLGDTVNARAVRILLECNLVFKYLCQ